MRFIAFFFEVEPGDIFVGMISSCYENNEFYIVKDGSENRITINIEVAEEIWWIPALYEKFILLSDGIFLRAVRFPLDEESDLTKYMKLFLLDTGESFIMPILGMPPNSIFEMPPDLKQVPALALKSQYINIEVDHDNESSFEFIQSHLYRKLTFEVLKVDPGLLTVNILPYFESELEDSPTETSSEGELTSKQVEIFYEEPSNLDDPLLAVQGFKTHDDDRICKFYDPKTGGCFKGWHCKLRHVSGIKDGTCCDNKEIYFGNIPNSLALPSLHTKVKIEITHFKDVANFFCRYWKLKPATDQHTLGNLTTQMNKPDVIATYKPLVDSPAYMQLVVVKSDGMFCRGRVEQVFGDWYDAEVLLVDFGTLETLNSKKFYQWCPRFNYLPFQTVEMQIANVKPIDGRSNEAAINKIMSYVEESEKNYLTALIFENVGIIKCTLFNSEDEDIGERLVGEGYAQANVVSSATPKTASCYVPV